MAVFTYPFFHTGLVGISPSELKTFHPLDMRALCEAFKELTGVDPLAGGIKPYQAWTLYLKGTTATALVSQAANEPTIQPSIGNI